MSLKTRKPELLGEISVTPEVIQKARIKFGNENIKVTEKKKKKFATDHPKLAGQDTLLLRKDSLQLKDTTHVISSAPTN